MYRTIAVSGGNISIWENEGVEYVSLSDMAQVYADNNSDLVKNWLNDVHVLPVIATWETTFSQEFNYEASKRIVENLHSSTITPKTWIKNTNAKGVVIKAGKRAGVYAHKELAFEFGCYLNPVFRVYILRHFTRQKEVSQASSNIDWFLLWLGQNFEYVPVNETISIEDYVIPILNVFDREKWLLDASELDMAQVATLGFTHGMWVEANPDLVEQGKSIDDVMTVKDFVIIENLKRMNKVLSDFGVTKADRFKALLQEAGTQQQSMQFLPGLKLAQKQEKTKENLSEFNQNLLKALNFDLNK